MNCGIRILLKHLALLAVVFLIIIVEVLYYYLWIDRMPLSGLIMIQALLILLWFLALYRWLMFPYHQMLKSLRDYFSSKGYHTSTDVKPSDIERYPSKLVREMLVRNTEYEKQRQQLLEELKSNNALLERNNKITNSIFLITSQILSSGQIDEILQIILDKAIEIIPNAQKGSILIRDGKYLVFKAVKGYDVDILKGLKLQISDLFQYYTHDFYQPCIVNNVEAFNKKHLSPEKFETLRRGDGFTPKSVLSCAILADNEFLGTINIDNTESVTAFKEEDKPLIRHLAVQTGIAFKNTRLIEQTLYLSRYDSLTNTYNRRYFEELLLKSYEQAKLNHQGITLVIFDINDLKQVNDTYGHEAGDVLINSFAEGVKSSIRESDIFARFGGDEFAVIFPNTPADQLEEIISRIRNYFIAKPFTYLGRKILTINFGYGAAVYPDELQDIDCLIRIADRKMYENKKNVKHHAEQSCG